MSKKSKIDKTNALRIVETLKLKHEVLTYELTDGKVDGVSVAEKIGKDPKLVFKTLVTQGSDKNYYVFVIPVDETLNLKAAAASVSVKSVEMIPVLDINKITGYVRGGCSPIGMKKQFVTVLDEDCLNFEEMIVSAGRIGLQMVISPKDLIEATHGKIACITTKS